MAERTAAMVGPLPDGVRPDEGRGAEENAALSSLQWRPSDARSGGKAAAAGEAMVGAYHFLTQPLFVSLNSAVLTPLSLLPLKLPR